MRVRVSAMLPPSQIDYQWPQFLDLVGSFVSDLRGQPGQILELIHEIRRTGGHTEAMTALRGALLKQAASDSEAFKCVHPNVAQYSGTAIVVAASFTAQAPLVAFVCVTFQRLLEDGSLHCHDLRRRYCC